MRINVLLEENLDTDSVYFALAMAAAKFEQNPKLMEAEQKVELYAPNKKFLGRIYISED